MPAAAAPATATTLTADPPRSRTGTRPPPATLHAVSEKRIDGRALRYQHRRPELLAAATEYVLEHGVGELSLRPMAHALGVGHATLIRHFATKDELVAEVLTKIRTDFEARLRSDEVRSAASGIELLRRAWERLCQPREQRQFLVLFELVSLAVHGDERGPAVRTLVDDWLHLITEALVRHGWARDTAPVIATLILAQVRGLQLDLLATGDRERVESAFDTLIAMLDALPHENR
ncbi:TetR/AcrR family transcriptional regulator [Nocardia puris]|uniref:TetR family transcriptional regulator n=1 Tax=Nocardia puris TaxID=208602 RepID=A0A366DAR5_9NOCA|nr:TetR/AcrR family transcriptional regulator [Nocardia puris]MBF6461603.1 TetR/AcrR family transcriptional regulator [Nocardia puris]RBO86524.1 TetR family transcriptional regulator [Nocardia puris]